jgi:hypothetical protein
MILSLCSKSVQMSRLISRSLKLAELQTAIMYSADFTWLSASFSVLPRTFHKSPLIAAFLKVFRFASKPTILTEVTYFYTLSHVWGREACETKFSGINYLRGDQKWPLHHEIWRIEGLLETFTLSYTHMGNIRTFSLILILSFLWVSCQTVWRVECAWKVLLWFFLVFIVLKALSFKMEYNWKYCHSI